MRPIEGFEELSAAGGEYETLPAGGYILTIKSVNEEQSQTGKAGVRIYFDIAQGEYRDFFRRKYDGDTRAQKKWGGTYWQMTEGAGVPFFKGLITAVEESNPGYRWGWDERTLGEKRVGGLFRREEYRKTDGSTAWITRLCAFRSTAAIEHGVKPPEDKPLMKQAAYLPDAYLAPNSRAPEFAALSGDDGLPF